MAKPWFLLLALTGCSEPAAPAVRTVHREALLRTRRAQPAPPERPAPTEGPWLQELRDENGTRLAMFSPPLGVQERRPLAVGLHGAYDHPSSACGEWRGTLGA